ncbi:MAG: hypothetical protein MJ188_03670 [Treponema sp.]|nr:hypothetical protein [Treponema sp.]
MRNIKKMFSKTLVLVTALIFTSTFMPLYSQETDISGINYVLSKIDEYGTYRVMSYSKTSGIVFVCGKNTCYFSSIPIQLYETLQDFTEKDYTIRDINISDNGLWYVLADEITFCNEMYPEVVEQTKALVAQGDVILGISFNDYGEYCIVTDKHYNCSSQAILDFVKSVQDSYGDVCYVHVGSNNIIVSCVNGLNWTNSVSENFYNNLTQLTFQPTVIKYFFDESFSITNPDEVHGTLFIN